jgi:hypothetical protein
MRRSWVRIPSRPPNLKKGTSSVHRGSNRFVPGRRKFGLSGCYGESLCPKPLSTLVRTLPRHWLESRTVTAAPPAGPSIPTVPSIIHFPSPLWLTALRGDFSELRTTPPCCVAGLPRSRTAFERSLQPPDGVRSGPDGTGSASPVGPASLPLFGKKRPEFGSSPSQT